MKTQRRCLISALVIVLILAFSTSPVLAAPGDTGNGTIPPGLTKVTFVHHAGNAPDVIIERGPGGNGNPFVSGEASVCSDAGLPTCDSFDWDGQHWPGASVEYNVNLKNSGDDGGFLSAIQPQRKLGSTTPVQPSQPDGRQQRRHVGRPK
ncbi:MAG: hypothetical protein QF909_07485 [SAR202 cluster bacterium]|nr:hypothetical protein [SAR202 cluster bacterium]